MPSPPALSHNLKIAKSCLRGLSEETKEGTATDDKDNLFQVLALKWGNYPLNIVDRGAFVTIVFHVEVDKQVKDKLSLLPDELREQYRIAFLQELMSNHRTGTLAKPQNLADIKQLEGFDIVQNIHLTDGALSCNRLVDGIQEIVSVAVRALNVITLGLGLSTTISQPVKPPPDIYI